MRPVLKILSVLALLVVPTKLGWAESSKRDAVPLVAAEVPTVCTRTIYHDGSNLVRDRVCATFETSFMDEYGVERGLKVLAQVMETLEQADDRVFTMKVYLDHHLVAQRHGTSLFGSVSFNLTTGGVVAAEVNARNYREQMQFIVYHAQGEPS
ncbi:hypothetical protein [Pseudodesulfovibrio sp. zrk46]|uniref:hypothetical protein n=1 Tax=Pseudodesulfovibrio sp. zrk46 TaxID=2725288 RepID=UPI0014497B16|nr:hypothetical protein [Pseudodesulfovibrio sp. zrk46]QJB56799.1 hypothetical protein HFN16_10450 [Pseudodesulfovibrio sp. zrk46]